MPPRKHSAASIKQARNQFLQVPIVCAAILVGIHMVPKEPDDMELRMVLTVAYFGALFVLLHSGTKPRHEYMQQLYEWQFEEAGPAMQQTYRLYLSSLSRVMNAICYLGMAFLACCAINVLVQWPLFSMLDVLLPITGVGWWITLFGLLLLPLAAGNLFSEAFQRHRVLQESVEVSTFKPRDMQELEKAAASPANAPPVLALAPLEFQAGGYSWHWEDFYKNSVIFGQSGTGKTVCVLNALLEGLLCSAVAFSHQPSGLILDPKGDFNEKIRLLCRKYGREEDLLVIDPNDLRHSMRWNPFDTTDDELELAARFGAVMESLGSGGGGDDAFWVESAKKFIRYSVALLRLVNPREEPPSLRQVNELAVSQRRVEDMLLELDPNDDRTEGPLKYFELEWLQLPENTRGSIIPYVSNMIDPFLMSPFDELFSGPSTFRVADMVDQGKILYVNMPIADRERMSRIICTFVKLEYYREVLKRPNKKRPSFFLCDEFQAFFTVTPGKGDSDFFERSRQSVHANIIATQNYPALIKQAKDKDSVVKNMLGNCAVKMFLRNTDESTNKYASELFGQQLVTMIGSGIGAAGGRSVGGSSSQSTNMQYDANVRPEMFIELAVPSRRDGIDFAETIVHMAARGFVTKEKLRWKVHPIVG